MVQGNRPYPTHTYAKTTAGIDDSTKCKKKGTPYLDGKVKRPAGAARAFRGSRQSLILLTVT